MLVVVTVSTGVPAVILSVAYKYFWQLGLALESFWCYQILATKSLKVESDRVYIALKDKGLEAGRKAVSMIVGRDTQNLTEEGVTKAAGRRDGGREYIGWCDRTVILYADRRSCSGIYIQSDQYDGFDGWI